MQPQPDKSLIEELRAVQEKILAYRDRQLIDIDQVMRKMRDERDDELAGLR